MFLNLAETRSHKDEWPTFNPPKYKAMLSYPMYKSYDRLQMEFRGENGYAKDVDQWLLEENVIPKMQMQHEEELKRKDREIRRLEKDLYKKKETIREYKQMHYCRNCFGTGHNNRTCKADPVSQEEKIRFQSRRIIKYKLEGKGWTKRRQKAQ